MAEDTLLKTKNPSINRQVSRDQSNLMNQANLMFGHKRHTFRAGKPFSDDSKKS
jgi:hypothetical protein